MKELRPSYSRRSALKHFADSIYYVNSITDFHIFPWLGGADYDKAKAHISKDEMLIKYLKRFNGSEKIIQLREAVSTGSFSAAYISAEEIYEISKTLALTLIAEKSFVLVNALKDGDPGTDIGFLIDELEEILLRVQMKIKEKLL